MILDSGPLIAALNRKDRHHELAVELLGINEGAIVPDPVVVEVEIGVRRRMGAGGAGIPQGHQHGHPHPNAAHRRALASRGGDRSALRGPQPGLVDAAVMAVAEARGEPVFTFDFRAFRGVPGPDNGAWSLVVTETDLR